MKTANLMVLLRYLYLCHLHVLRTHFCRRRWWSIIDSSWPTCDLSTLPLDFMWCQRTVGLGLARRRIGRRDIRSRVQCCVRVTGDRSLGKKAVVKIVRPVCDDNTDDIGRWSFVVVIPTDAISFDPFHERLRGWFGSGCSECGCKSSSVATQFTALVLLDCGASSDTVDHTCLLTVTRDRFCVGSEASKLAQYHTSLSLLKTVCLTHYYFTRMPCVTGRSIRCPDLFHTRWQPPHIHWQQTECDVHSCFSRLRTGLASHDAPRAVCSWTPLQRILDGSRPASVGTLAAPPVNRGVLLDFEHFETACLEGYQFLCFYFLSPARKRHVARDFVRQFVSAFVLVQLSYLHSDVAGRRESSNCSTSAHSKRCRTSHSRTNTARRCASTMTSCHLLHKI